MPASYAAPRNPVEEALVKIWAEVLSLDEVGIHDDFFDLGGHSLAATRIISRVMQHFQLAIPMKALFESPTVAEMAAVIAEHPDEAPLDDRLESEQSDLEARSNVETERVAGHAGPIPKK
jgi:acyl carrier protein